MLDQKPWVASNEAVALEMAKYIYRNDNGGIFGWFGWLFGFWFTKAEFFDLYKECRKAIEANVS